MSMFQKSVIDKYLKEINQTDLLIDTFKAVHDLEECICPHSIGQVFKNGNKVSEIKPSSVKSLIRNEYEKSLKIIKMPIM